MEQNKQVKQNWTVPKNFDIWFCKIFLAGMTKVLYLEGTLSAMFCLQPVVRFSKVVRELVR